MTLATPTAVPQQSKIEELESIRGLAAWLVVFYHMPKWNTLLDVGIFNNGYLMVDLFFVMSGYVIFRAYAGKIVNFRDVMQFQFLRFGRLYPVHLLFLALLVALEGAKFFSQTALHSSIDAQPFAGDSLNALWQQLLLVQSLGPTGNEASFNAPAWSISTEFYTYLLFAFAVLLAGARRNILFAVIALISLLLVTTQMTFGFDRLLKCFAGFFIGCLMAYGLAHMRFQVGKFVSLAALGVLLVFLQFKRDVIYDPAVFLLSVALIGTVLLSPEGYLSRVLRLRFFTFLGKISYSVYMSHWLILSLFSIAGRRLLHLPFITVDGIQVAQLSVPATLLAVAMFLGVIACVSYITFTYVETPLRSASRRIVARKD